VKLKFWIAIFITSLLFLSCEENDVKSINLKNAIFKAEGNNPSWKLEIDSNNGIHFYSNSKLGKIITPSSKNIEIMDVAATSYHAETESATIKVEIFRKQCINSKNHSETKYEVRIQAKKNDDLDFISFIGCGEYIVESNFSGD
jgi:uncharacterized membrane protein